MLIPLSQADCLDMLILCHDLGFRNHRMNSARSFLLIKHVGSTFGKIVGQKAIQAYFHEFVFRFSRLKTPMAAFQTLYGIATQKSHATQ